MSRATGWYAHLARTPYTSRMPAAPPAEFPHVVDHKGCPLAYWLVGGGPPVLFIQGVGVAAAGCQPQVDGLSDRFQMLTFDNRGIGRSVPAGGPLSVEQMADDARAVMDAAGWASAHVVGHSLGGPAAVELALTHPGRVRSLALLCTFATGRKVGPLSWRLIWAASRSQLGPRRVRRRAFLELIWSPDALRVADRDKLADEVSAVFGRDLADPPAATHDQLKAMKGCDCASRLGEVRAPTLVLSGAHDPIAPPALGRALAAGITGARYVEWADASHAAPVQFPDRTNTLLAEHFARADLPAG
ncbi:MAG: alpha/beta hydrolase [Gemmataceae bacterium]|nr:alpha/beta hydrolase [Gemmataceae bacterium]